MADQEPVESNPAPENKESFTSDDLKETQTQEQTTQQTDQPESPEFNIPEKFLGTDGQPDIDRMAKSYVELEKAYGRSNNQLGTERADKAQLQAQVQQLSGQRAGPQPSPNNQGQDVSDLNTQFWDQPVDVIKTIIDQRDQQVRVSVDQEKTARAQQAFAVANSAIQQIAFEDNTNIDQDKTTFIYRKLEADNNITSKLHNGTITRQDIESAVRKYDKEARDDSKSKIDGRLKELGYDPESIKAFNKARKSGAVSPDGNLPANRNSNAGPSTDMFNHIVDPDEKAYLQKGHDDLFGEN